MREEIARQPVTTHRYNGKRYLTFDSADQILAPVKARLQASLLTDEEISDLLAELAPSATYGNGLKAIAQAQLDKSLNEIYRDSSIPTEGLQANCNQNSPSP